MINVLIEKKDAIGITFGEMFDFNGESEYKRKYQMNFKEEHIGKYFQPVSINYNFELINPHLRYQFFQEVDSKKMPISFPYKILDYYLLLELEFETTNYWSARNYEFRLNFNIENIEMKSLDIVNGEIRKVYYSYKYINPFKFNKRTILESFRLKYNVSTKPFTWRILTGLDKYTSQKEWDIIEIILNGVAPPPAPQPPEETLKKYFIPEEINIPNHLLYRFLTVKSFKVPTEILYNNTSLMYSFNGDDFEEITINTPVRISDTKLKFKFAIKTTPNIFVEPGLVDKINSSNAFYKWVVFALYYQNQTIPEVEAPPSVDYCYNWESYVDYEIV